MGRFTLPRDLYHGKGSLEELKHLTGKRAILVVGGDGSVLGAMHFAVGYDLPLFGINLGRVGYLAEIEQDEIPQLPQLLEHAGTEERMLLSAYGAQLVLTPGEEGMAGAVKKADEILQNTPGAVLAASTMRLWTVGVYAPSAKARCLVLGSRSMVQFLPAAQTGPGKTSRSRAVALVYFVVWFLGYWVVGSRWLRLPGGPGLPDVSAAL